MKTCFINNSQSIQQAPAFFHLVSSHYFTVCNFHYSCATCSNAYYQWHSHAGRGSSQGIDGERIRVLTPLERSLLDKWVLGDTFTRFCTFYLLKMFLKLLLKPLHMLDWPKCNLVPRPQPSLEMWAADCVHVHVVAFTWYHSNVYPAYWLGEIIIAVVFVVCVEEA